MSNAVLVLKHIVQVQLSSTSSSTAASQHSPLTIVSTLARKIEDIRHSDARACVLWVVGQYASSDLAVKSTVPGLEAVAEWAPDVLRIAVKTFANEVGGFSLYSRSLRGLTLLV